MITNTVNRFVIQNTKGQYYNGQYDWSDGIWNAKLYTEKPFIGHSKNKIIMISVTYKEYSYEISKKTY